MKPLGKSAGLARLQTDKEKEKESFLLLLSNHLFFNRPTRQTQDKSAEQVDKKEHGLFSCLLSLFCSLFVCFVFLCFATRIAGGTPCHAIGYFVVSFYSWPVGFRTVAIRCRSPKETGRGVVFIEFGSTICCQFRPSGKVVGRVVDNGPLVYRPRFPIPCCPPTAIVASREKKMSEQQLKQEIKC